MGLVQDSGETLVAVFLKAVPLPDTFAKGKRASSRADIDRMTQAGLQKFYEAARNERENRRLGLIGRARVAFFLQQRLLAAGYAPELVKQVLFAMLVSAFVGK